jgi:hypothetical protein
MSLLPHFGHLPSRKLSSSFLEEKFHFLSSFNGIKPDRYQRHHPRHLDEVTAAVLAVN